MNAHSFVYVGNLVAATVNFLRSALGALSRQGRALTPEENANPRPSRVRLGTLKRRSRPCRRLRNPRRPRAERRPSGRGGLLESPQDSPQHGRAMTRRVTDFPKLYSPVFSTTCPSTDPKTRHYAC